MVTKQIRERINITSPEEHHECEPIKENFQLQHGRLAAASIKKIKSHILTDNKKNLV